MALNTAWRSSYFSCFCVACFGVLERSCSSVLLPSQLLLHVFGGAACVCARMCVCRWMGGWAGRCGCRCGCGWVRVCLQVCIQSAVEDLTCCLVQARAGFVNVLCWSFDDLGRATTVHRALKHIVGNTEEGLHSTIHR